MIVMESPRLRALVATRAEAEERCDLCDVPLASRHEHVFDRDDGALLCACHPCGLLFDREAAAGGRLQLVREHALRLDPFAIDDAAWQAFRIPVDVAYFVRRGDGVAVYYPSAAGAVGATLAPDVWEAVVAADPRLAHMTPDVEALLVDRLAGVNRGWIASIDICARLVGVVRTSWRGFTGGIGLRRALDAFFEELP